MIPETICNIIEKGKNNTLEYQLTIASLNVPSHFHQYLGIFQQLDQKTEIQMVHLEKAFAILSSDLVEYLLNFIVLCFESSELSILDNMRKFFPTTTTTKTNKSKVPKSSIVVEEKIDIAYCFYLPLFSRINIYFSEIHLLASVYSACIGRNIYFGNDIHSYSSLLNKYKTKFWDLCTEILRGLECNLQKKEHIRGYVLESTRKIDKKCKYRLERYVSRDDQIITNAKLPIIEFFYNNDKQFGVFNISEHAKILVKEREIKSDTVRYAFSVFMYEKLDESQILKCINSEYVFNVCNNLKKKNPSSHSQVIINRIIHWIQKYPTIIKNLSQNIHQYVTAFISLMYLCFSLRHCSKHLGDCIISQAFNKNNFDYLFKDRYKSFKKDTGNNKPDNMLVSYITSFTLNKLVDDDFIFNILYCGLYKYMFSDHYYRNSVDRCRKGDREWYSIKQKTKKDNRGTYQRRDNFCFSIFGLPKYNIRNRTCYKYFFSHLGINTEHSKSIDYALKLNTPINAGSKPDAFRFLGKVANRNKPNPRSTRLFNLALI